MTLFSSWFWPDVSTRKNATFATTEAFYVLLGVATLVALFTFVDFARGWEFDERLWGFAEAAVLVGIAFGIRQKSRVAAVAGFALLVLDRIAQVAVTGHPGALLLAIAVALALLHGVRGACAFHKFAPIPANTPGIEQSFRSFGQNSPRSEKDTGRN